MKVLLLGSNPSEASPNKQPFHPSTKSRQILDRWFDGIETEMSFINIRDEKTPNNRPLRVSEIRDALPRLREKIDGWDKIVALGKTASKALSMLGNVDYFEAPHPSGLNRFWNCSVQSSHMIQSIRDYVNGERNGQI